MDLKDIEKTSLIPYKEVLSIQSQLVSDVYVGKAIAHQLFKVLDNCTTAKFLSANQLGIDFSVGVINVREPLYFINPKIIDTFGLQFEYIEGDNSLPGEIIETMRFGRILVSAINFKNPIWFGVKQEQTHLLYTDKIARTHPVVEECIAIQHMIDNINGISVYSRNSEYSYKNKPEHHRNEIVTLVKDNETMKIKYKKAKSFIDNGWSIKN
jgi:peptide deformylase